MSLSYSDPNLKSPFNQNTKLDYSGALGFTRK